MKYSIFFTSFASLAGLPLVYAAPQVEKRQAATYYLTLCTNEHYLGRCARLPAVAGICCKYYIHKAGKILTVTDSMREEYNDFASSARTDTGGKCTLYAYIHLYTSVIKSFIQADKSIAITNAPGPLF